MSMIKFEKAVSRLQELAELVGPADRRRIELLLPHLREQPDSEALNLAAALNILFAEHGNPVLAFRQFRGRVNKLAEDSGKKFSFAVDTAIKSKDEDRVCFFLEEFSIDEHAFDVLLTTAGKKMADFIPAQAIVRKPEKLRFFVSYAHADDALVDGLLAYLKMEMEISEYEFEGWTDKRILAGENWAGEIARQLDEADFCLLLVSKAFLTSKFIQDHELPNILSASGVELRCAIPVGLKTINFQRAGAMPQLVQTQLFRYQGKFFSQLEQEESKSAFAEGLCMNIEQRIARLYGELGEKKPEMPTQTGEQLELLDCPSRDDLLKTVRRYMPKRELAEKADAEEGGLARDEEIGRGAKVVAIDHMLNWSTQSGSPPYMSLLGEYGLGKTTHCRELAHRLVELLDEGEDVLVPFYFDLKDLNLGNDKPALEEMLDRIMKHAWKATGATDVSAVDILQALHRGEVLLILDGLDEQLVNLDRGTTGRAFIHQLWSALPEKEAEHGGKLLLSCRSHYFRDLAEQRQAFIGSSNDKLEASKYTSLTLLPFSREQVEGYLHHHFDADKAEQVANLIKTVHNLEDLAERPYLLDFIRQVAPKLESEKQRTGVINTASLYKMIVAEWLERDANKHKLTRNQKHKMMVDLAAALWQSKDRLWAADQLDDWLETRFAGKVGELEEVNRDVRTATFVVRPGDDNFRFAHTSFLEYFLALWLLDGLKKSPQKGLKNWAMQPEPSPETLDFVGDMLATDSEALVGMNALLEESHDEHDQTAIQAKSQLLRYWLRANERGMALPIPVRPQFNHLILRDMKIAGSVDQPLCMKGANLNGVWASGSDWRHVVLRGASIEGAKLARAVFSECDLSHVKFSLASVEFARFHECVSLGGPVLSNGIPVIVHGHSSVVSNVGFSMDGRYIVSGANDHTCKIWDVASGVCVQTLVGHTGNVICVALSVDGLHVVTGSGNGECKIWEISTGICRAELLGHKDAIWSVDFSPNGERVVSASSDTTCKVWDVSSGNCEQTFRGHAGKVFGVSYSPCGTYVVSGGEDCECKVWELTSGKCENSFYAHRGRVWDVVISKVGKLVASGAADGTCRVWDLNTGKQIQVLRGFVGNVHSVSFSGDGRLLAVASNEASYEVIDLVSGIGKSVTTNHGMVRDLEFSTDGKWVVSGGDDFACKLWCVSSGYLWQTMGGISGVVTSICLSRDGAMVASGSSDGICKIWDALTGSCVMTFKAHVRGVSSVSFSNDGKYVISASDDGTGKVWSISTGGCKLDLIGHQSKVSSVSFNGDDTKILSSSFDRTIKLWCVLTGVCLQTYLGHEGFVFSANFSEDDTLIVTGSSDHTCRVWDMDRGECEFVLRGHSGNVADAKFGNKDGLIVSCSSDNTCRVWDLQTRDCVQVYRGHSAAVNSVNLGVDGKFVLSGGADNLLKVWDVGTGEDIHSIFLSGNGVKAILTPCQTKIVVAVRGGAAPIQWFDLGAVSHLQSIRYWYHLPENEAASIDLQTQQFEYLSEGAWRWAYNREVTEDGEIIMHPVDAVMLESNLASSPSELDGDISERDRDYIR